MSESSPDNIPDDAYDAPPYVLLDRRATLTHIVTTVSMFGDIETFTVPHRAAQAVTDIVDFHNIVDRIEP